MKIDAQEIKKIIDKYENNDLDIFIEFSRWGIRLGVSNGMFRSAKLFTYDMLDDLPDVIDYEDSRKYITLEFIVDEFVKDFKHELHKMQNESEDSSCTDST